MNPESSQPQQPNQQSAPAKPAPQPSAPNEASQPAQPIAPSPGPNSYSDNDQILLPTKNMPALKSYYFSCVGIIPVLGAPFSILAIINGRKALELYKNNPTPGAKAHAIFGISLSILELVFLLLILLAAVDFIVR